MMRTLLLSSRCGSSHVSAYPRSFLLRRAIYTSIPSSIRYQHTSEARIGASISFGDLGFSVLTPIQKETKQEAEGILAQTQGQNPNVGQRRGSQQQRKNRLEQINGRKPLNQPLQRGKKVAAKNAKRPKDEPALPIEPQPELSLVLPDREDITSLPINLLKDPGNYLYERLDKVQGAVLTLQHNERARHNFTTTFSVGLPGYQQINCVGHGVTKRAAKHSAFIQVIAKLHEAGLIAKLWPEKAGNEVSTREKDALRDVYNYCAKYLMIPQITYEKSPGLVGAKSTLHVYTIQLEEQKINVTAVAKDPLSAEILAAMKFKIAAEAHANSTGLPPVKEGFLSDDTAKSFHDWYKSIVRSYAYKVNSISDTCFSTAQASISSKYTVSETLGPMIVAGKKGTAEALALLGSAIRIVQEEPRLLEDFAAALRAGNGRILSRTRPVDLKISDEVAQTIQQTLSSARRHGFSGSKVWLAPVTEDASSFRSSRKPLSKEYKDRLSLSLASKYQRYLQSDSTIAGRRLKSELPMNHYKKEVYSLVQDNIYSIIVGATGSGKTTQVPQIILEQYYQNGIGAECEILCTQPRRIAATSVASRVGEEMGQELRSRVGHHVRFDARLPERGGSITYCTTGILLLQLQNEPDLVLDQISHLIIDEVHERDMTIDFTLTILKKAIADRLQRGLKVPRVTLMSATLDTELFSNYFTNPGTHGKTVPAPILSVPGRTFPVTERYLEDILVDLKTGYNHTQLRTMNGDTLSLDFISDEKNISPSVSSNGEIHDEDRDIIDWKTKQRVDDDSVGIPIGVPYGLVATTIAHIIKTTCDGAILAFFPGLAEMQKVEEIMRKPVLGIDFADSSKYRFYLLHSSIADSQKSVFEPVPDGVRKIILSTNIGETSITIPEVRHVVDTGQVRELQYNQKTRISKLQNTWISKSNAKQRAGRAGRVQNGYYFAMYSKARHRSMRAIGLPELLRADLQTICLNIKSTFKNVDIAEFLASAIERPEPEAVAEAIKSLQQLDALTTGQDLTALGKLLASLPFHPDLGKMVVLGVLFKCLDPILVISAEERSLFIMAPERKAESLDIKQQFGAGTKSDHISKYNAFCEVREHYSANREQAAREVAYNYNIHFGAWKTIYNAAAQTEEILKDAGLIPKSFTRHAFRGQELFGGTDLNQNSNKPHIVRAILMAGLSQNLALWTRTTDRSNTTMWRTEGYENVMLPRTSIMTNELRNVSSQEPPLVTYSSLVESTDGKSMFLRDASVISPLAVCLFGKNVSDELESSLVDVNGWMWFSTDVLTRNSVLDFRDAIQQVQMSAYAALAAGKPLHDDPLREVMSQGVVDVLEADLQHYCRNMFPWNTRSDFHRGSASWDFNKWSKPKRGRNANSSSWMNI
ncbi:P-loop containing nucleoside triphosphate hydrolase protein [Bisporella sp. PMI_857]|nr:P-loop containing nucleoside triphosphate hydrolase protein [Bisporella sp. PMI_857]